MPLPTSLVVKNGSKMRGRTSGEIPQPLSATLKQMNFPARAGMLKPRRTREFHVSGLDEQRPAPRHGIAGVDDEVQQHLLDHGAIGHHAGTIRGVLDLQSDVFPRMRCSIFVMRPMTSAKFSNSGCSTCLQLKASNWRVRLAARSAARQSVAAARGPCAPGFDHPTGTAHNPG